MFNNAQAIDLPSVVTRTGKFYIDEVLSRNIESATPFTALQHAQQLRASAVRRRAYHSAVRLIQSATKPDTGELDVFEAAQQLTMDIQGERPIVAEATMDVVMDAVDAEVKENRENSASGKRTRIPTGFYTLDGLTYQGWGPGQLIILAARPSIGKTAIMLQMAKAAARSNFPATIFSLEMTKEELGKRLLFSTGRIRPFEVATGNVDGQQYAPASQEIRNLPIYINDESRTLAGLLSRITVSVMQGRCKIAFIDYLGLITIDESGRSPLYQQIAKATRELKLIAKRQKIPIVLLCQLNREAAKEDRSPQLYDLRDSGSIEQDADVVLMLEQEKRVTEDQQERPNINIWVRKNRQFQKDIKITVKPNDSYSSFKEINDSGEQYDDGDLPPF
jgi:replicative DNA helicase